MTPKSIQLLHIANSKVAAKILKTISRQRLAQIYYPQFLTVVWGLSILGSRWWIALKLLSLLKRKMAGFLDPNCHCSCYQIRQRIHHSKFLCFLSRLNLVAANFHYYQFFLVLNYGRLEGRSDRIRQNQNQLLISLFMNFNLKDYAPNHHFIIFLIEFLDQVAYRPQNRVRYRLVQTHLSP